MPLNFACRGVGRTLSSVHGASVNRATMTRTNLKSCVTPGYYIYASPSPTLPTTRVFLCSLPRPASRSNDTSPPLLKVPVIGYSIAIHHISLSPGHCAWDACGSIEGACLKPIEFSEVYFQMSCVIITMTVKHRISAHIERRFSLSLAWRHGHPL
jgi:hypothetical protein